MKFPRPLILALVAAALWLPACGGDDDPTGPETFKVTVVVSDPSGNPVPGLDLSLVPDTPFYQDGKSDPGRPAVTIPFQLDQESDVRLSIEDIEGTEVRLLGDQTLPAGRHTWVWNGWDDGDQVLPSGVYTVRMVVRLPGQQAVLHEETRQILMAMIDPGRYSVGTTDAQGRIEITDRRLFPSLYGQPDIPAVDENADAIGMIRFTGSMRFGLADLTGGGSMRFYEEVTGPATFDFTWIPPGQWARDSERPVLRAVDVDPVPETNELGQPYPVPFN